MFYSLNSDDTCTLFVFRSIRHGCPASLYLRVTKDRTHLQVRSFVSTHTHEISEVRILFAYVILLFGSVINLIYSLGGIPFSCSGQKIALGLEGRSRRTASIGSR